MVFSVSLSWRFRADVNGDLTGEIAVGDGGGHLGDVADLAGKVRGHEVDVVGEILPSAADAGTCACPPSFPSVPTSRATRVTSPANALSWSTMVLMVSLRLEDFRP